MTKIKVFSSNAISDKVFGPSFASNIINFNTKQKTGEKLKEKHLKHQLKGKNSHDFWRWDRKLKFFTSHVLN